MKYALLMGLLTVGSWVGLRTWLQVHAVLVPAVSGLSTEPRPEGAVGAQNGVDEDPVEAKGALSDAPQPTADPDTAAGHPPADSKKPVVLRRLDPDHAIFSRAGVSWRQRKVEEPPVQP